MMGCKLEVGHAILSLGWLWSAFHDSDRGVDQGLEAQSVKVESRAPPEKNEGVRTWFYNTTHSAIQPQVSVS